MKWIYCIDTNSRIDRESKYSINSVITEIIRLYKYKKGLSSVIEHCHAGILLHLSICPRREQRDLGIISTIIDLDTLVKLGHHCI